MGKDIHIKIAKYNKETNLYEQIKLYRKVKPNETSYDSDENGFREVWIDVGRDYEAWEGMKDGDESDGFGLFPWNSISLTSLEPCLAEEIKENMKIDGYFDFYEINLAEFKLYLNEHPTVVDYDAEWKDLPYNSPKPQKENPIKTLFEAVVAYISVADWSYSWTPTSYYKVIFYFDW